MPSMAKALCGLLILAWASLFLGLRVWLSRQAPLAVFRAREGQGTPPNQILATATISAISSTTQEGATPLPLPDRQAVASERHCPLSWGLHVQHYGLREVSRQEARAALQGKTIVFMGDSAIRKLYQAMMDILSGPVELDRHADHSSRLAALDIDVHFLWRPFPNNLTAEVNSWTCSGDAAAPHNGLQQVPDVVVAGSLLWHVLHVANADAFEHDLGLFVQSARTLWQRCQVEAHKALWWTSPSQVVPGKLTAADKVRTMTSMQLQKYTDATERVISTPWSSTSFTLLDMLTLTLDCGPSCTSDGLHYCTGVYHAAVLKMMQSCIDQM